MTPDDVGAWLDANAITSVRTEGVTHDGLVLGKYLSRAKFERSLPLGPAMSDLAFAYDIAGTPYIGWWDAWRQECFGDIHQRPDTDSLVVLPDRPGTAACVADYSDVHGNALPVCTRSVLRSVVDRLAGHGLTARAAFELEGMVFAESYAQARQKGFRGLTPPGIDAPIAYLVHDARPIAPFMEEVVRRLDALGIAWEAWSAEAAPGQFELNLEPADPVTAADRLMRLKCVLRDVAIDQGCSVTFMAKPSEAYGSGMHIHHSLLNGTDSAFYDASATDGRSRLMRRWIGGLMQTMAAATSILVPTINSYRRMIGFQAAPTVAGWAEDNKSVALRLISRNPKLARVEHRVGAADLNPYLSLAAILAGGIVGIEQDVEPPEEMRLLAWGLPERFPHLPNSITKAADALEADKALTDLLGPAMTKHWIESRRWEWMMFHTTGGDPQAASVTDWELNRYFELV